MNTHDCDDGEKCSMCPFCYKASGRDVCAYACAHDNGYEKRCAQIDDPYYGGRVAQCLLVAGHDGVCVSINERGNEVWWT